ncbi:unnamed protein product, partial [Iphiclides podalirius]
MSNRAWVTLATNDSYGLGALVLAHSLRRAGTAFPAVVLITPSVTEAMRERLGAVFADVSWDITFTKIHCWNLTQYEKCVFLDADTLVVQNCDELFEREELSAAPDVGWPDCFNSGVFVYRPSAETFAALIQFAQQRGSFDGGDQGLLNSYFSDWARGDINKHLPFLYNVTSAAFYSYLPALKHYGQDLKIIHFIGAAKPWLQQFDWRTRQVQGPEHLRGLLQLWWDLFVGQVHAQLDSSMVEVEDATTTFEPPQESYYPSESRTDYNYYKPDLDHYKPVLDPDSEFHWHRPDTQISHAEKTAPEINLGQFHDPWDIYKGHIPPMADESKSTGSHTHTAEEQQEIRRHVWEVPQHFQHIESQDNTNRFEIQHVDTHHDREKRFEHHTHSWTQPDATQFHQSDHYNLNQENHEISYREHYDYNKETQSTYSLNEHSFTHSIDQRTQSSSTNHQEYDNISQHSHGSHSQYIHRKSPQFHERYSPPLDCQQDSTQSKVFHETSNLNEVHHNNHSNDYNPPYSTPEAHGTLNSHSQSNHDPFTTYTKKDVELFTHSSRNRVEYVYCVHLDHERGRYREKRNLNALLPTEGKTNGLDEWEMNGHDDFVIPRHPYDGFYLRHRMTIDARGRKICTHEIPPTPSPSVSPPESPIFFDAVSPEDACSEHDHSSHTGVAGNLARVTPDATGAQSEAIDELTRRQGWEAGNIDYMGADSFANIWAKISQTLSQPPASPQNPPTPPPEESEPAQQLEEPQTTAVEAEQSAVAPISKEEALAETATPTELLLEETSVKSDVPSESAPAVEVASPIETIPAVVAPNSQVAPVESTTEAPKEAIPIETSISPPVSSEEASVPVETADIPTESSVPVEIPVPVVEAVLAEATEPTIAAAPIESAEIPAPVLEASAAVESTKVVGSASVTPVDGKTEGVTKPADTEATKEEPPKPEIVAAVESPPGDAVQVSAKSEEKPAKPEESRLLNLPRRQRKRRGFDRTAEERRRPVGKLQLSPPLAADPLPTPDSELEDAASLAQSIIASELRTPTVTSPTPPHPASPAQPQQEKRLSVEPPQLPTPPVSLTQIGVKPSKGKATIAAQIESSVTEKPEPAPPAEPKTDAPKKRVVKKVVKKEAASGEAPVPPPRKKEKKPKEK